MKDTTIPALLIEPSDIELHFRERCKAQPGEWYKLQAYHLNNEARIALRKVPLALFKDEQSGITIILKTRYPVI